MKERFLKIIILSGIALSCPLLYAKCQFQMKGVDLYFETGTPYKVSLSIKKACSNNTVNKRKLTNIVLRIHKDIKHSLEYKFDEGYWLPGNSKFVLKKADTFKKGCLKGVKKVQIDLNNYFINSTNGLYLNFKNKKTLKINCAELALL